MPPGQAGALGTVLLCSARMVAGAVSGEGELGAEGENCSLTSGQLGCRAARAWAPTTASELPCVWRVTVYT